MPINETEHGPLMLPRLGAAVAGAALLCPALTMPLVLGCLAALSYAALNFERSPNIVPETPPAPDPDKSRARRRMSDVTSASEDSFPASDPPSWTPVSGTGTRH
jgi:hypothetical protein